MLTGYKFDIFHQYIEEKLGRPVFTHELADENVVALIKEKAKEDFFELCKGEEEKKMKAILVIDMPKCCLDCPCSYTYGNVQGTIKHDICEAAGDRRLSEEEMNKKKPMWCPLKQLPQKRMPKDNEGQGLLKLAKQYCNIGFNACLDEITGEKE